jgi:hypothetical protein
MVIADLTDPSLTPQDAEVLFAVLVQRFSTFRGSKLLVVDEVGSMLICNNTSVYMQ